MLKDTIYFSSARRYANLKIQTHNYFSNVTYGRVYIYIRHNYVYFCKILTLGRVYYSLLGRTRAYNAQFHEIFTSAPFTTNCRHTRFGPRLGISKTRIRSRKIRGVKLNRVHIMCLLKTCVAFD